MAESNTITTIGAVSSIVGAGISAFSYYKYQDSKMMLRTVDASGVFGGFDADYFTSRNIWSNYVNNYKTALIVGLIVLAVGIILLISGIASRGKEGQAAIQNDNTTCCDSVAPNVSPRDRIEHLNVLKSEGLISEEEYEEKRKDILSSL